MSEILKIEDVPDETMDKLRDYKERNGLNWKGFILQVEEFLEELGELDEGGA